MAEINQVTDRREDLALRQGLRRLAAMPGWLVAIRYPDQICPVLNRVIPELARGEWTLESYDVGQIRLKDQVWSNQVELGLKDPRTGGTRTVTLKGLIVPPGMHDLVFLGEPHPFLSEGWKLFIPDLNLELSRQEPETVLTSLDFLTVPEQALQFLNEHIRLGSPAYRGINIRSCAPRIVRYKPGSRCTILYDLDYAPLDNGDGRWPRLVAVKTYRGEKGQNAYDSMKALWESPLGSSPSVTVAEPLAYVPEKKVLIQGPIREEQTLKDLETDAIRSGSPEQMQSLREAMLKTARGLAELHRSRVEIGRAWAWENEREEVRGQADRLGEAIPELAFALNPLFDRLTRLAQTLPADPLVPSHGTFRPAQVLLSQGKIGFIDFDSFCQSEPSLDLGLFLGTFMSIGLTAFVGSSRKEGSERVNPGAIAGVYRQLAAVRSEFLEEYKKWVPVSPQRVALWETLVILMLVLHCWIKVRDWELDPHIYLVEQLCKMNGIPV